MASSGTVTGPTIDVRLRPFEGHDTVLLMGRVRHKSTMVLEAGDLTLRTIKNAVAIPAGIPSAATKAPVSLCGSVAMAGSLMNAWTLRVYRGTLQAPYVLAGTTRTHIGTKLEGTVISSFFIAGA